MKLISFAQNAEDVVLARVLSTVKKGTYIDIGAGHPTDDSVTKHFYDQGWTGINVEPDQRHYSYLESERPNDINLQLCVSEVPGEIDFWITQNLGWSTSEKKIQMALEQQEILQVQKVETISIDDLLNMSTSPIHFLKLDCEGGELRIIESSKFLKIRPWIIVVESIEPRSNRSLHVEINELMMSRNYEFKLFDGLNDFYVDKKNSILINSKEWYPACVIDNFQKYSILQELETYNAKILKMTSESATNLEILQNNKKHIKSLSDRNMELEKSNQLKLDKLNSLNQKITTLTAQLDKTKVDQNSLLLEMEVMQRSRIWRTTKSYRVIRFRLSSSLYRIHHVWRREKNVINFSKKLIVFLYSKCKGSLIQKVRKSKINVFIHEKKNIVSIVPNTLGRPMEKSALGQPPSSISAVFKQNPYVLVGATAQVSTNSGVQRVARSFVESLFQQGFLPILVKVNVSSRRIEHLSDEEVISFFAPLKSKKASEYSESKVSDLKIENGVLLIPEVPYLSQVDPLVCQVLLSYCNSNYLLSAAIYFDSIPLTHPEYLRPLDAHESYLRFLSSCILVSSISKNSENELRNLLTQKRYLLPNFSPALITQHLPLPSQLIDSSSKEIPDLLGQKFIIAVGTVEPRKNQGRLIEAFENVFENLENSPVLVIVGNIRDDVAHWKLNADPKKIIWISGVSDDCLKWLYENCMFTVFISLLEGFGYPILESQYFGKICITSNLGSMQEIAAKGGCILVDDPTSVEEIQSALIRASEHYNENFKQLNFQDWGHYTYEFYSTVKNLISQVSENFQILYWVDHTIAFPANTGIQRVVRGLARTLLDSGIDVVPVKWNSTESRFEIPTEPELINLQNWNGPEVSRFNLDLSGAEGKQKYLIVPELTTYSESDHLLGHVIDHAKRLNIRVASVFHDALPVTLPEVYSYAASQKHSKYMGDLIKSDLVFTTSKSVHKDLCDYILSQKLVSQSVLARLVRLDLPTFFRTDRAIDADVRKRNETTREGYKILCVGTLEPRKNHVRLLEAFAQVVNQSNQDNLELILVGRSADNSISQLVNEYSELFSVTWKDRVTDEELEELYKNCSFTVFPSIAEGFGLPILESLSFGKPVICGFGSAFDQITEQGGCLQVNVNDTDSIASAISSLIYNPGLYENLVSDTKKIVFRSWEEYGSAFMRNLLNLQLRGSDL
jgi:FkbM family methyltransferase